MTASTAPLNVTVPIAIGVLVQDEWITIAEAELPVEAQPAHPNVMHLRLDHTALAAAFRAVAEEVDQTPAEQEAHLIPSHQLPS